MTRVQHLLDIYTLVTSSFRSCSNYMVRIILEPESQKLHEKREEANVKMILASHGRDKRVLSNEKRLQALKLKMTNKSAFIRSTNAPSQRVTFSSSEDEKECPSTPGNVKTEEESSTISKKLLFSSDDELPDVIKTRYDGQTGNQLFAMQQKIGNDARFQVNENFLDDSSDVFQQGNSVHNDKVLTEPSIELQKEKSQAMNILSSMFGNVCSSTAYNQEKAPPSVSDMLYLHYDPSMPGNAALEHCCTSMQSSMDAPSVPDACPPQISEQVPEVQVTGTLQNVMDRFYAVNPNLTSLFGDGQIFTFLQSEDNDIIGTSKQVAQDDEPKRVKQLVEPVGQKITMQPDSTARFCFFFHATNPKWSNRLAENSFYRIGVLDEIEQEWKTKKPKMKECCRQRWKDAIKRTKRLRNKINAGRN